MSSEPMSGVYALGMPGLVFRLFRSASHPLVLHVGLRAKASPSMAKRDCPGRNHLGRNRVRPAPSCELTRLTSMGNGVLSVWTD